ncbi:MAG: D-alanyl-D-alanine carboxypeptidase [Lachnospiraceae bacterium]|nr:D-alanyl-D-alanine carboxypeptidase [Lachnospiraceae bacterium]
MVKAALLIECESNEVIYAFQENEQITPASITKLMTALLSFEKGDLKAKFTVSEAALDLGFPDATKCGLKPGDSITLGNALYGLLLPSGNEAAGAIGEYISGDVNSFVALMNQRATELGMSVTNFGNPHGLPCDGHLTSAWDISLLMRELLKYETFFEIADNDKYEVAYLDAKGNEKTLEMKNTNLYYQGKKNLPEGIVLCGGKTGYTDLAGNCLVLYVKNSDNKMYIAEIFGAKGKDNLYAAMNRLLEIITDNE